MLRHRDDCTACSCIISNSCQTLEGQTIETQSPTEEKISGPGWKRRLPKHISSSIFCQAVSCGYCNSSRLGRFATFSLSVGGFLVFPGRMCWGSVVSTTSKRKALQNQWQWKNIRELKSRNPLNAVLGKQIAINNLQRQRVNVQLETAFPRIGKKFFHLFREITGLLRYGHGGDACSLCMTLTERLSLWQARHPAEELSTPAQGRKKSTPLRPKGRPKGCRVSLRAALPAQAGHGSAMPAGSVAGACQGAGEGQLSLPETSTG